MIPLPSVIVIDFCEWLQERIDLDVFELVFDQENSGKLEQYAREYLDEGGFGLKRLFHLFIDSEEFLHFMSDMDFHRVRENIRSRMRNYGEFNGDIAYYLSHEIIYSLDRYEFEEAFRRFITRTTERKNLRYIADPISPSYLADSTRIVLGYSEDINDLSLMKLLVATDTSMPIVIDFLDWLLLNKNKPMELQKMPLEVFTTLVDEYCDWANKDAVDRRQLIKAFKQTDPVALARRLVLALSNTQAKKMKSFGYIYDRYSSQNIPFRCLFLPLAAEANDFKHFIKKYWIDLNSLSSNYLDIYYSDTDASKSGYEIRSIIKSIPQHLSNDLPCLLIWQKKIDAAQMIDIKGLSHSDLFRLVSSIVDMIKDNQTLSSIKEGANRMAQEFRDKDRPMSFSAADNAQMNIAWGSAEIKATQNNSIEQPEIQELLAAVKAAIPVDMSKEDYETVSDSLEVIESEACKEKPKKSMLKTAVAGLKAIKGSAEFGAAVVALIQFIQSLI